MQLLLAAERVLGEVDPATEAALRITCAAAASGDSDAWRVPMLPLFDASARVHALARPRTSSSASQAATQKQRARS